MDDRRFPSGQLSSLYIYPRLDGMANATPANKQAELAAIDTGLAKGLENQKLDAEIKHKNAEIDGLKSNRQLKEEFARKLYNLEEVALAYSALLVLLHGFHIPFFSVSDAVVIAVISGVSVSSLSLAVAIATGLLK